MAKPKYTWFAIPRETIDAAGVATVLDNLRYDAAVVESNPPEGMYLFRSEAPRAPTVDRWRSHGIRIDPRFVARSEFDKMRLNDLARAVIRGDAPRADPEPIAEVLRDLVLRCDGAEGVRKDDSNIDTQRAHAALRALDRFW